MLSENIWFSCLKSSNKWEQLRCHAYSQTDRHTKDRQWKVVQYIVWAESAIKYLEIIFIIIPCRSACTRSLSTLEGFCWSIQMDWKYTIFDRYKVDVGDMWGEKTKVNENHLALATSPVYEIVMLDLLQTLFSSTSLLHHALLPCLSLSSTTFPLIFYNTSMLPPILPSLFLPTSPPSGERLWATIPPT